MRPSRNTSANFHLTVLRQFPPDRRYLIGVSGGRDSVALLHELARTRVSATHCLPSRSSAAWSASTADARFVEKLGENTHLECEIDRADVRGARRRTKQSDRDRRREWRATNFSLGSRVAGVAALFLGHHADDLVETFLINLFRGAGPGRLWSGCARSAPSRGLASNSQIVRPLLRVWREEIDAYVKAHRLQFREDATNESLGPAAQSRASQDHSLTREATRPKRAQAIWRAARSPRMKQNGSMDLVDPNESEAEQLDRSRPPQRNRVALQRRMHSAMAPIPGRSPTSISI